VHSASDDQLQLSCIMVIMFLSSCSIFQVDFAVQSLYSTMTAQQKLFARHAEQIMKINEISSISSRIQMALDQTLPVMERLNSILPVDDQLEKFSIK
jgi:BLOC-1 related complex subunit 5